MWTELSLLLFLPLLFPSPSPLLRLPSYCLTSLSTSMLISRFLVSSLFCFLLYLKKKSALNNWIYYIDFVPPRLFPSLSL